MDAVAVGARLGSSAVAPLVRRLFVRDGPGAGLVDRPVRLSALVSFRGEKRTLGPRELRRLTVELVDRGLEALGPHETAVLAEERQVIVEAVAWALHRLGDLDMDDVQAVRLGHRQLAQRLLDPGAERTRLGEPPVHGLRAGRSRTERRHRPAPALGPLPTRLGLSPSAQLFVAAVVEAACLHVLHFFTQRSTFVARTLLAHSRQLDQLITRADILIERVPARPAEDAAFEERYAEYVAQRHSTLTIYGIDLDQAREWPLDTAYLSLEATPTRSPIDGRRAEEHSATPQPAERALSGHHRVLLRGVAGSGKTTLVQWLAVTTARQDTGDGMTHLLGRLLPSMPYVAGTGPPETIYRHLLERSGLLREPATDTVDFVHRTFQDYLGAREAVEERDFPLLIDHAHLDQWEDVVRMAVAHARVDERARLLSGLVVRGDQEEGHRTRLHLLAMACLEHATRLDPAVRETVEERAGRLIPPWDLADVRALAEVGPVVLELLPGPEEGLADEQAWAVVQTAAMIGTDAALPVLARFRDHPAFLARAQLALVWQRFDTEAYFGEIVTHLAADPELMLTASSPAELALLSSLGPRRLVGVRRDFTGKELAAALLWRELTHLHISGNDAITDLSWIPAAPRLAELHLGSCSALSDITPPAGVSPRRLFLRSPGELRNWSGLSQYTALEELALSDTIRWPGLDALPVTAPLTDLRLPAGTRNLAHLRRWPTLQHLNLGSLGPLTPDDWHTLPELPRLTTLVLGGLTGLPPAGLTLPHLTEVGLSNTQSPDLGRLGSHFPGLTKLIIDRCPEADLTPLADLPGLRTVEILHSPDPSHLDALSDVEVTIRPRPRP